ncbi:MAG: type II toxin-antitoxin system VapC family toxin [Bryobacterales bacterium]|nr:type II toxin-antitoxin system VapC family toxin [Bryobacterales bacterium]MBV9396878.1 type II toxin-antitoxin system VapC family toxin [Bryobacterales bacterium]MBV9686740.1 type II toxin-antitoxin system VapC family toxin [Alphaproteobacteria bacterium]
MIAGYLIDTNVISEVRKPRPHGAVIGWLRSVPAEHLFISAVTIGELQAGIELTRSQDDEKAREIEAWLDEVAETYQVLPMDGRTFREWARLMHRRPDRLIEDAMITATARIHGLTVVTRNTRDFAEFKIPLLNPFAL